MTTKIIVIGLDGATFDLINPFLKAGNLPNIRRIIGEGFSATLMSTIPPVTAPAWVSMVTGLSPGNTGVFYFLNRKDENFDFLPLDSSHFANRSVWDYLDRAGMGSAVYNFPMLYPPYSLNNGYMVSGIGAPENDTIVSMPEIYDVLKQEYSDYKVHIPYSDRIYKNDPDKLLFDLKESLKKRFDIILRLLERADYDLFFGVISETDWASHYFWGSFDPSYTGDPRFATKSKKALSEIWNLVDENLGKLIGRYSHHCDILIVSDHGFGAANSVFYINQWLLQKGYISLKKEMLLSKVRMSVAKKLATHKHFLKNLLKKSRIGGDAFKRVFDTNPMNQIDLEESLIFAPKQNFATGMLYFTPKGKAQVAHLLPKLKQQLREESARLGIRMDVLDGSSIYRGKMKNLAPELVIKIDNYACLVSPFFVSNSGRKEVLEPSAFNRNISGSHREEGILLAYGHRISSSDEAERAEFNIWDVCPTLLYGLGVKIPEGLDGRVIKEIFKEEYRDVSDVQSVDQAADKKKSIKCQSVDNEQIIEKLKGLGYL